MVAFTKRAHIESWLNVRSADSRQDEAMALCARSALRVLPALARTNQHRYASPDTRARVALPVLRAMALSWVSARIPAIRADHAFAERAAAAAYAASTVSASIADVSARAEACGYAAAYAASAADSEESVISAAASVQASAAAAEDGSIIWHAATADADALESGQSVEELAASALWPSAVPDLAADGVRQLQQWMCAATNSALEAENWDIWFEWLRARIAGRMPWPDEAETACVLDLSEADWAAGPVVANAKICSILQSSQPRAGVAAAHASLENRTIDAALLPRKNIIEVMHFSWPVGGRIGISPVSPMPAEFRSPLSRHDHRDRLAACLTLAKDLIELLTGQRYQGQGDFLDAIKRYQARLPQNSDRNSNLLPADNEARFIREMFQAEFSTMGNALRARLKTFLEAHQGLRVFYPGLQRFYADVRSGHISELLPLDAGEDVIAGIQENTPDLFEPQVAEQFATAPPAVARTHVTHCEADETKIGDSPPLPPDPLGELDADKAADLTFASKVNALWSTIVSKTQEADKSTASALKLYERLKGPVARILHWCDML